MANDPLSLFMGWKAGEWVARQRGKTKEQYEMLFDREVTATASDSGRYNYCEIMPAPICFAYGCVYRVTEDNTMFELVADGFYNTPCIGNMYLKNTDYEDTGEDFFIYARPESDGGMYFTFRNEGTFNIKIEKKLGCENAIFFSWYGDDFYPNLPERDEDVYPYVGIFKKTTIATYKIAYASKTPFVYNGESFGIGSDTLKTTWSKVLNSMTSDWNGWSETGDTINATKLYWANHDVLNSDGTVYLAASEPVPIN